VVAADCTTIHLCTTHERHAGVGADRLAPRGCDRVF
jgi:hypothetical protein